MLERGGPQMCRLLEQPTELKVIGEKREHPATHTCRMGEKARAERAARNPPMGGDGGVPAGKQHHHPPPPPICKKRTTFSLSGNLSNYPFK